MNRDPTSVQSMAVFDAQQHLIDWDEGFAEEFADAATLLYQGISAAAILDACLLPERALDLSWLDAQALPPAFDYINSRRSLTVTQSLGVNGHVIRIARTHEPAPRLHPGMLEESADRLRSAALQISTAVLRRREQEHQRLHELALKDGLTGVANRRYFNERLDQEWQRCRQDQLSLSMLFLDIDFFKRYNDHYGHVSGDECLKAIADLLKRHIHRPRDLVARYGGEEFICLLPSTDLFDATRKALELETAVRALALPHGASDVAPMVTISLGVASTRWVAGDDPSVLIKAADQLLYEAKAAGRGCVRSALYTLVV
ncbi:MULTISPECIES: diguanylate cyclase [unclassified Halomonas]|uniref:diguanylate cyclase n=1 Tax=unclassified Halomonas TaxID=2609666 RepID=UPI0020766A90|nr:MULTISPECIES: diguanylate cyclase [unclassified Halomonas]